MNQPSVPPPLASQPPLQPHGGGVQVRCAGCRRILTVGPGLVDFVCGTCQMHQMLPPELMSRVNNNNNHHQQQMNTQVPAQGIDPTKIQLPCVNCKALLNVPHGLSKFSCPQCSVDLAVDFSKLQHIFPCPPTHFSPPPTHFSPQRHLPLPPPPPSPLPTPPLPPPEEVNEVFFF